jgi:hypothetical protein
LAAAVARWAQSLAARNADAAAYLARDLGRLIF